MNDAFQQGDSELENTEFNSNAPFFPSVSVAAKLVIFAYRFPGIFPLQGPNMQAAQKGVIAAVFIGLGIVGYSVKSGYIFVEGVSKPPLVGSYSVDTGQRFEVKGDGTWTLSLSEGFRNGTWVLVDESHIGLKSQSDTGTGTVCTFAFAGYSALRLSECSLEANFTRI